MKNSTERLGALCKTAPFTQSSANWVLFILRPHPPEAWMGWVHGSPISREPEVGQDIEQEGDCYKPAGPWLFWGGRGRDWNREVPQLVGPKVGIGLP